jgi:hypothetical protein
MFCDGCGIAVQPGQGYCSKCGKQILGPIMVARARSNRVKGHVQLLGLLWLAIGAFNVIGGVVLYALANTLFAHMEQFVPPNAPVGFLRPFLSVIAILLLAKAACCFIAGYGVLQHEHWARIMVLVLAFISLFTNIPFGTALGIYTMWVLLPAESQAEYEQLAESRPAA